MITANKLPSLVEINRVAGSVKSFPVSAPEMVGLARHNNFSESLIEFYDDFPDDQVFEDYDDLLARSEQVQIMSAEQPEQPWERLGPQE